MALTSTQKQKILRYIGWPDIFIKEDSRYFSGTINKRLDELTPEAEADTVSLLNRCIDIDAKLAEATSRLAVTSVSGVGGINRMELSDLRAERNRVIEEMMTTTFLFPPEDYNYEVY